MVNPLNENSPKGSYAQVAASPKPRGRTIMTTFEVAGKTKGKPSNASSGKIAESKESEKVDTSTSKDTPMATAKSPEPATTKVPLDDLAAEEGNPVSIVEKRENVDSAPRILLLAKPEVKTDSSQKRKFEDTPSKVKQPPRPANFHEPSRKPEQKKPSTHIATTVDAFTHPSEREAVYADDPEPGVLPEPAYFNETPPHLRYPQDVHLKELATLMTSKDVFMGDDFEHRKEGVRLQELARSAGGRLNLDGSESSDDVRTNSRNMVADPSTNQDQGTDRETSFPPSPTPLPRQRRPLLPSLNRTRAHSSQGIPVRHLFTNEYEMHYPTQYTRFLGTRSPRGSNDYNQNASEASFESSDIPSLPSGEYPGIFHDDVEMRDASPAPPYQGSETSQENHEGQDQEAPMARPQGNTEGQNDPLRTWNETDTPGVVANARGIEITSTPPNGWPDIFIRYLPDHDINDASRHLLELAEGPGSCLILPFKCSQSRMQQLATLDRFRNIVGDLVTLQPGQR
ncbi:hypothetical protein H0H93_007185, partial [Arthromyces matolae]